jgi:outer membrane protein assembly factor BamA
MRTGRIAHFTLCLFFLVSLAAAQKQSARGKISSADDEKLVALKATGTVRYTDKEILAASGLQIGQKAADGDFKEAAQRLGNSGMFSDVVYSYTSSGAGIRLELQLTDVDKSKLVPVHFENFVWFTDEELRAAVQSSVPLFKQSLPIAGALSDRVTEALQAILSEKQLPGRVDFLRNAEESSGTLTAIDYQVEEVDIRIHGVEFPGASPEQAALLATAASRLTGAQYDRSALAAIAKFDLLPVYLQHGYLKAEFGPSDARVVTQSAPAADTQAHAELHSELQVDAILPVTPGKMYATSSVTWKGAAAITAGELTPLIELPPGQPADAVRLLRDIDKVSTLYRSRGYMMVQIKPDMQFDDEKSTVRYDLNVVEGDLYKMGELEITGLDTQATVRMRDAWILFPGQPYNADYPKKFLDANRQLLPRVPWNISIHETPDPKDKTVDVEIHFKQQ